MKNSIKKLEKSKAIADVLKSREEAKQGKIKILKTSLSELRNKY